EKQPVAHGHAGLSASRGRVLGAPPVGRLGADDGRGQGAGGSGARRAGTQEGRTRDAKPPVTLPLLIASDVDGTLLTDDDKSPARTRAAITAAEASGT